MRFNNDKTWLERMVEIEKSCDSFMVGGAPEEQINQLVAQAEQREHTRLALSRLIELGRRKKRLSMAEFANKARISLEQAMELESVHGSPSARTIYQVAQFLALPQARLMNLAGLTEHRGVSGFEQESLRFAARSKSMESLSPDELKAFEDYVKYLNSTT